MKLLQERQNSLNGLRGRNVIMCSPGSFRYKLFESKLVNAVDTSKNKKVVVLTFSHNRVKELYDLVEYKDKVKIMRIDEFCIELLADRGHEVGLPKGIKILEEYPDKQEILWAVLEDSVYINQLMYKNSKYFNQDVSLEQEIIKYYDEVDENEYDLNPDDEYQYFKLQMLKAYKNKILEEKFIDRRNLIKKTIELLDKDSAANMVRNVYGTVMIEEGHNLSGTDYQVLCKIVTLLDNAYIFGVPSRHKFGFDMDEKAYFEKQLHKDAHCVVHQIRDNLRMSRTMANLHGEYRQEKPNVLGIVDPGSSIISYFGSQLQEAREVSKQIVKLIKEDKILPSKILITARKHSYLKYLLEELEKSKIETYLGPIEEIKFDSFEIQLAYELIMNTVKPSKVRQETICKLLGCDPKIVGEILSSRHNILVRFTKVENITDLLTDLEAMRTFYLLRQMDDEHHKYLMMSDLIRLEEAIKKQYEDKKRDDFGDTNYKIRDFIKPIYDGSEDKMYVEQLTILTSDRLNNEEYDIVFVIGCSKGMYPLKSRDTAHRIRYEEQRFLNSVLRAKYNIRFSFIGTLITYWEDPIEMGMSQFLDKAKPLSKMIDHTDKYNTSVMNIDVEEISLMNSKMKNQLNQIGHEEDDVQSQDLDYEDLMLEGIKKQSEL